MEHAIGYVQGIQYTGRLMQFLRVFGQASAMGA